MSGPRLVALSIDNFGLIRHARVDFAGGLTVFSGETGSGKTMLLGALSFALGERASADAVRGGADRAVAAVEIDPDDATRSALAEAGFDVEPGELLVISRDVSAQGKSSARVNGRPAPAAAVRELAQSIVDFAGQHEAQRLLSPVYQCDVLDRFAGDDVRALRAAVADAYARRAELAAQVDELSLFEHRAADALEDARFALAAIDDVSPQAGEDDRLRERRDVLSSADRIADALAAARDALADSENSAADRIGEAASALARAVRLSPKLQPLSDSLAAAEIALGDVSRELARELEALEFSPGELESIADRLDRIERLKRRHGGTIDAVIAQRAVFAQTLDQLERRDGRLAELKGELERANAELAAAAETLSARRRVAAEELETRTGAELRALAMPAARLSVTFAPLESIGPRGAERVEFALSPNAGEPARPLARAASGGELSRVLLALAVVLADRRETTALVFDEIDAGIGGATAAAVGERLAALAARAQVVCVTHLAQIASWSDAHYTLRKSERGDQTIIDVVPLDEPREVESEIARMLSGSTARAALDHAGTLLREARKRKGGSRISA